MTNNSINVKNKNIIRIIAGRWRSRKLTFPGDIDSLRPTPDRVRETVFNWLQPKIAGARCLDLFTGSGAFSFEAGSREASSITAIDNSSLVIETVQENCRKLGCTQITTVLTDGLKWLQKKDHHDQFDIVFLDPPYNDKLLPQCCRLLTDSSLLAPGCIIYIEANHSLEEIELPQSWQLLKMKKAGQIYFGLCENIMN